MFENYNGLQLLFVLISLIIAMSIHEAMHAFTSHWLGDTTAEEQGRLSLNPLKHIDIYITVLLPIMIILGNKFLNLGLPLIFAAKPVPFNPNRVRHDEFGVALVGLAGPVTNLVLAIIGALLFRFLPGYSNTVSDFLVIFTLINVSLFVFNMIPFPPLDGSRVLYAFAPDPVRRVMEAIESMGFAALLFFLVIAFQFIGPIYSEISQNILRILLGVNY